MCEITVRPAVRDDIPAIGRLLYEVHKVHSDVRPDLFKAGARKYTDAQLEDILADAATPVFVAERGGEVAGYAFCIFRQFPPESSMTDVKSLYIDDLCVEQAFRGEQIGSRLYAFVLDYAKRCGCYNVTLNVWADNAGALRFYEKIGMRVQKIGMETIL